MALVEVPVTLTGIAELVLHNGWVADPLLPLAQLMKRFTGKRKKTDQDYRLIGDLEWVAAWYYKGDLVEVGANGEQVIIGERGELNIPMKLLFASFWGGSRKHKLGELFKSGCWFTEDGVFDFDGKDDLEKMITNPEFRIRTLETVNRAKVVRTRPILRKRWQVKCTFHFDDTVMDSGQVEQSVMSAGRLVGLGERRPSWGRYDVQIGK